MNKFELFLSDFLKRGLEKECQHCLEFVNSFEEKIKPQIPDIVNSDNSFVFGKSYRLSYSHIRESFLDSFPYLSPFIEKNDQYRIDQALISICNGHFFKNLQECSRGLILESSDEFVGHFINSEHIIKTIKNGFLLPSCFNPWEWHFDTEIDTYSIFVKNRSLLEPVSKLIDEIKNNGSLIEEKKINDLLKKSEGFVHNCFTSIHPKHYPSHAKAYGGWGVIFKKDKCSDLKPVNYISNCDDDILKNISELSEAALTKVLVKKDIIERPEYSMIQDQEKRYVSDKQVFSLDWNMIEALIHFDGDQASVENVKQALPKSFSGLYSYEVFCKKYQQN